MKKIISVLFALGLCFCLITPCLGADFANPPIVDLASYLNEDQFIELSEMLEAVRQKYNFDVAIFTETELTSADAVSSSDDIYDYGNYGAGENDDGIMLYICSATRTYNLTTHADGIRVFNNNGIKYLKKNIEPYLADDNYYLAMKKYVELSEELLAMAAKGAPFNKKQYDTSYILIVLGCGLLIPLIIAFIAMKLKLSKMKTAVENNYAADYVKPGSRRMDFSRDIFLYSNIIKTPRPKNNSSTHTSSSGRTHGGGGGSF